ncbi:MULTISPECIES: hypothetical protein [unclassified Roseibium]|uniref:hypothetical protein n=1 Tax=unclassified Roseibium TaxID=2629323 RepID=UPI00273D7926|nr:MULTISPECIES: hypothetical protein [unclassified Roseibium]
MSGKPSKITQHDIAVSVMGLPQDFDPSINAHVRIEMKRLRDALDLFYAERRSPDGLRVDIKRGQYVPELRPAEKGTPRRHEPCFDAACLANIGVCLFGANDRQSATLNALVQSQLLVQLSAYPFYESSGIVFSEQGGLEERRGSKLPGDCTYVIFGKTFHLEDGFQCFFSLLDCHQRRVVARYSKFHPSEEGPFSRLSTVIAAHIGATLCDPIAGALPHMLAHRFPGSSFAALMCAFNVMGTQNGRLVEKAIFNLKAASMHTSCATSKALLADMMHVSSNFAIAKCRYSDQQVLDQAEDALLAGPNNPVARLAKSYALLKAERAHEAASHVALLRADGLPEFFQHDVRLLTCLTAERGALEDGDHVKVSSSRHVFEECGLLSSLFRTGRYLDLINATAQSANQNIFWISLFGAAAHALAGEQTKARDYAGRLTRQVPQAEQCLHSLVGGFFLGADRDTLTEGLVKAGLKLEHVPA